MLKRFLLKVVLFLVTHALLCVACTTLNIDASTPSSVTLNTEVTEPAKSPAPTSIILITGTPTSEAATASPQPSIVPTLNVTTPTPQPMATLSDSEITVLLSELMVFDEACQLPCWWGIRPGESSLEATLSHLHSLGFQVFDSAASMQGEDDFLVFLEFQAEADVIRSIEVGGDYATGTVEETARRDAFARGWQDYSVKAMIANYGLPSRIALYAPFQADPGGPRFRLYLFYETLGFVAQYRGDAEQVNGARYRACLDLVNMSTVELFLYQPGAVDSIVEYILPSSALSFLGEPELVYDLVDWEHATGTSLESLATSLTSSSEPVCVEFSN